MEIFLVGWIEIVAFSVSLIFVNEVMMVVAVESYELCNEAGFPFQLRTEAIARSEVVNPPPSGGTYILRKYATSRGGAELRDNRRLLAIPQKEFHQLAVVKITSLWSSEKYE